MDHPHDHLFRAVFAASRQAEPLLRLAMPAELTAALDWSGIECLSSDLRDPALGANETDAYHAVPRCDGRGRVHFVLEHKSGCERFCAVQTHRYAALGWLRFVAACPPGAMLPPIVTVVVHHDRMPWRGPTSIAELLPEPLPGLPPQPQFAFVLVDLARHTEASLLALGMLPLGTLALLYLQCLRFLDPGPADAALQRWAPVFRAAATTSPPAAFEVFHAYALEVTELPRDRLAQRMASVLGPEARNHVMSTADKLRREGRLLGRHEGLVEGRVEGRVEGLLEGRVEGRVEGRAEILLQQLQKRFGSAAENSVAKVRSASIEQLDRWALRILDATSLDDVFAPE